VWFTQLEGQFALSSITQDATKFYYFISHLENKYAAEVEDVITNPPPTSCYKKIKAELIRRLSLSEEQRVRQLSMHEEMGDRRLMQFLRHLQPLAGPSVPSDFLRTLWTINNPGYMGGLARGVHHNSNLHDPPHLSPNLSQIFFS
jgi:hypothetical protein